MTVSIVHAYPFGPATFSQQDDGNEQELVRLAQNRNGEKGRVSRAVEQQRSA